MKYISSFLGQRNLNFSMRVYQTSLFLKLNVYCKFYKFKLFITLLNRAGSVFFYLGQSFTLFFMHGYFKIMFKRALIVLLLNFVLIMTRE